MKAFKFMEKRIDPFLLMILTDLARTLAEDPGLEVDFALHSYYDRKNRRVTISSFWDRLPDERRIDGMKTDVYLRAYGHAHFTDETAVARFLSRQDRSDHPSFAKQLLALFEEHRVARLAIQDRPGMKKAFMNRSEWLRRSYRHRYHRHLAQGEWTDALFCGIAIRLEGRPIALKTPLDAWAPRVRAAAETLPHLATTEEVCALAEALAKNVPSDWPDMTAAYVTILTAEDKADARSLEKSAKALADTSPAEKMNGEEDAQNERFSTWHREQKQAGNHFLSFDLNKGAKTDLLGTSERKMENGDQAFATVYGASRRSDGNRYDRLPEEPKTASDSPSGRDAPYGAANRHTEAHDIEARPPSAADAEKYRALKAQVAPSVRALKRTLQKTLEHRMTAPRHDLHAGRLGKRLVRIATEENPRLFFKKSTTDPTFDAAFYLLVDCSASMHDKMADVQKGLVLFHETLQSLSIPHAVTGFWEDALAAKDRVQPNYFLKAVEFERSLLPDSGLGLLQLEPQEDNRDGFAIRIATERFINRPEKHKWLIVFTDGEPSAYDYADNGILDTQEAVRMARKKGIRVIGVFLSDGNGRKAEAETLKDIYGTESLIVPSIKDIPEYLSPLLRKLIHRTAAVE